MARNRNNNRRITTPQSLNAYVKGICDIMRRSNCAGALQYVPELTWMLFLRILDEKEERELERAQAVGAEFQPSLDYPYRWRDWAAPEGKKRQELEVGTFGGFMSFVDGDLIPTSQAQRQDGSYCSSEGNQPSLFFRRKDKD